MILYFTGFFICLCIAYIFHRLSADDRFNEVIEGDDPFFTYVILSLFSWVGVTEMDTLEPV